MELRHAEQGITPAYAGNTQTLRRRWNLQRDHPRVCGEHSLIRMLSMILMGSPPRMRGTPQNADEQGEAGGITPAYAGNTAGALSSSSMRRDHPRVCGEHGAAKLRSRLTWGSPPRMRGTQDPSCIPSSLNGITPAYAGNTILRIARKRFTKDHPRVCGEHGVSSTTPNNVLGSPPRMRGTH